MTPRFLSLRSSVSFLLTAFFVTAVAAEAGNSSGREAAHDRSAPSFLSLYSHGDIRVDPGWTADRSLQSRVDDAVHNLGLERLVSAGRLGVALVDLTSGGAPRIAEINGNHMIYAASVPKIAVLYAAYEAQREGKLLIDKSFHETLVEMVRVSSNIAASAAIRRLGFDYIASVLWTSGLYDPSRGGGLWLGKAYGGPNDYWHPDPVSGTNHGATPVSLAHLLTLLAEGRLVDADASREMLGILGNPGIHHKFVRGLDARPGSVIFRKSGSWRKWHGDAALIEREGKRYVAVALCEDEGGSEILERLIVALDDCVPRPVTAAASLGAALAPGAVASGL